MRLPDRIGRYHVQALVGVGGFAMVLRAHDAGLDDTVAIKVLAENWTADRDIRGRFVEEARLLRRIASPHLIAVHDVGELEDGRPYFVMEYADRGTLANRVAGRPGAGLDGVSARTLATVLAAGLGALHQAGVVHRDVNPRNLLIKDDDAVADRDDRVAAQTRVGGGLIAPSERLLIGDLGLAKNLVSAGPAASVIGGTPRYQAPEQLDPNGEVRPETDVFAATGVLWEAITGRPPPDPSDVSQAVLAVDEGWRPFFEQGLAGDADDRFIGMQQWLDAVLVALGDSGETLRAGAVSRLDTLEPASPYQGLAAFQPDDALRFFGRDALVADLVERLRRGRVLVVAGPSGSGKSSVVRAGLIPAVAAGALQESEHWPVALFTPRQDPIGELIHQIERAQRLATQQQTTSMTTAEVLEQPRQARVGAEIVTDASGGMLIVIDQFEELFTQTATREERQQFIDVLSGIVDPADSKVRLVLVMRADFYAQSALYPWLAERITANQLLVGPMQGPELRQAIEEPARRSGLRLEDGLVDAVLADGADEPGALPLVSHAMEETWRRRKGSTLTLDGYRQTGGVGGAIALTAETVYGRLDPEQRDAARRLMLRLVTPGEGASDTRRVVPRAELIDDANPDLSAVADALISARLLTADADTLSIAHEALIQSWPRLHEWIDESRDDLRTRQRIGRAAVEWDTQGRDPDLLYRGIPLQSALGWATQNPEHLGGLEREFLEEGEAVHVRLEHEAALAQRRSRQVRTAAIGILGALLAVSVVATVIALNRSQEATDRLAASLATQAADLVEEDPRLALGLAVEAAARGADTFETRTVLVEATGMLAMATLAPAASPVAVGDALTVAVHPDGSMLAIGRRDGDIELYESATGATVSTLRANDDGAVTALVFTQDGDGLLSADDDGVILLWDVSDPTTVTGPQEIGPAGGAVWGLTASPDGSMAASASEDGVVQLWDLETLTASGDPLHDSQRDVLTVAFSPDGRLLLAGDGRGELFGWTVADRIQVIQPFNAHRSDLWEIVFSPRGDLVATASSDRTVRVWDLDGQPVSVPFPDAADVRGVQFLDDDLIVAGDEHGRLRVWDVANDVEVFVTETGHSGQVMASATAVSTPLIASLGADQRVMTWTSAPEGVHMVGHEDGAFGLAASPDGLSLASGDGAGNVRVLSVETGQPVVGPVPIGLGPVWATAYSPDGSRVAAGGAEGDIAVVDVATGQIIDTALGAHAGGISAIVYNGDRLITGGGDGIVQVWNDALQATGPSMAGHIGGVTDMALAPDGTLAVADRAGTIHFWDPSTGSPAQEALQADDNTIWGVAWSTDGTLLAAASDDQVVLVWEIDDRRLVAELTPHPAGATDVGFLGRGRTVATTSRDGSVQLFDVTLARRIGTSATGHSATAWRLAVLPDRTRFATSSEDGSVQLWDALHLGRACERADGAFDAEQQRRYLGEGEGALGCN